MSDHPSAVLAAAEGVGAEIAWVVIYILCWILMIAPFALWWAGVRTTRAERRARRAADAALADRLERDGIEAFVDEWERQPVFASHRRLPAATAARLRSERLRNRPAGLAASLRGAGQGVMAPLHDRLAEVRAPTLVIAGALDPAGCARADIIAAAIPDARLVVLAGAGHTPHLETPTAFRSLTLAFLEEEPAA